MPWPELGRELMQRLVVVLTDALAGSDITVTAVNLKAEAVMVSA